MIKTGWILVTLLLILLTYFFSCIVVFPPHVTDKRAMKLEPRSGKKGFLQVKESWLQRNESGLWEMYVAGPPFERGIKAGKLTRSLSEYQEQAFIGYIRQLIPSGFKIHLLRFFAAWYNRYLESYVTAEYQQEIYGESLSASDRFDYIGPKYQRLLYYHAAHDLGHVFQDKGLTAGCTSFAVKGHRTRDGHLLIGRNFDFYAGDAFSENKIVAFINPDSGYRFMTVTWGGMIGVVSGMNDQGLTVTLNAARSKIPSGAATPVSLLAREILQYARNIRQAVHIASGRRTFVAEALMIGSDADGKAVIIEKAPGRMAVYETPGDELIGPNHFQSDTFALDEINLENMHESSSVYRMKRMKQLLTKHEIIGYAEAASILRDARGLDDSHIGLSNEKCINQLMAHHAVIFKPHDKQVWVSTAPYQLGRFVCYDLDAVFAAASARTAAGPVCVDSLAIPPDGFLASPEYTAYRTYRIVVNELERKLDDRQWTLSAGQVNAFVQDNPEYYYTYALLGEYFEARRQYDLSARYFGQALQKEIPTLPEREAITERLQALPHQP